MDSNNGESITAVRLLDSLLIMLILLSDWQKGKLPLKIRFLIYRQIMLRNDPFVWIISSYMKQSKIGWGIQPAWMCCKIRSCDNNCKQFGPLLLSTLFSFYLFIFNFFCDCRKPNWNSYYLSLKKCLENLNLKFLLLFSGLVNKFCRESRCRLNTPALGLTLSVSAHM